MYCLDICHQSYILKETKMNDENEMNFEEWWDRLDDIEREEYDRYVSEERY